MIALQSDQIDQLAAALVAAPQADIADVHKNAKNKFLGNTYADLSAVRAAVIPAFASHGLAVLQPFVSSAGDLVQFDTSVKRDREYFQVPRQVLGSLRTLLVHTSGQWIASELPIATAWGDAQRRAPRSPISGAYVSPRSPVSRKRTTTARRPVADTIALTIAGSPHEASRPDGRIPIATPPTAQRHGHTPRRQRRLSKRPQLLRCKPRRRLPRRLQLQPRPPSRSQVVPSLDRSCCRMLRGTKSIRASRDGSCPTWDAWDSRPRSTPGPPSK